MNACLRLLIVLTAGAVAGTAMLSAHHSRANFDTAVLVKIEGTVVEYRWRNPHVVVVLDSTKDGKTERWTGELSSIGTSLSDGLTRTSLKNGDSIRITAHPAKAGTHEGIVDSIERSDGTLVYRAPAGRNTER